MKITLDGVREYCEEMPVLLRTNGNGLLVIEAYNEGGFNCTQVDLVDLLLWIANNEAVIDKAIKQQEAA